MRFHRPLHTSSIERKHNVSAEVHCIHHSPTSAKHSLNAFSSNGLITACPPSSATLCPLYFARTSRHPGQHPVCLTAPVPPGREHSYPIIRSPLGSSSSNKLITHRPTSRIPGSRPPTSQPPAHRPAKRVDQRRVTNVSVVRTSPTDFGRPQGFA